MALLLDVKTLEKGANFTFETPYGDFDVLAEVAGIHSFEELRSAADEHEIAGLTVKVASLDHLIAMKRASNRPKDRNILEEYLVIADHEDRSGADRGDS